MSLKQAVITRTPLIALLRLMNRQHGRILLYHRVVSDRCPAHLRGLLSGAITSSAFARQLDYLARHYRVVSLDQMIDATDDLAGTVAITFDDGYADNYLNAWPLLKAREMPATLFMTTGLIGSDEGAWRDRLARKVAAAEGGPLLFPGGNSLIKEGSVGERMRTAEGWMKRLSADQRAAELVGQPAADEDRFLDQQALIELDRGGFSVESHSVTHPHLSTLDKPAAMAELSDSKAALESLLERPVSHFAYPYGDFSAETRQLAEQAGYHTAFAARRGCYQTTSDRFAIPRLGTRQSIDRFALRLAQRMAP